MDYALSHCPGRTWILTQAINQGQLVSTSDGEHGSLATFLSSKYACINNRDNGGSGSSKSDEPSLPSTSSPRTNPATSRTTSEKRPIYTGALWPVFYQPSPPPKLPLQPGELKILYSGLHSLQRLMEENNILPLICGDSRVSEESEEQKEVRSIFIKALVGPLLPIQQSKVLSALDSSPRPRMMAMRLLTLQGGAAKNLPLLVEHCPALASSLLIKALVPPPSVTPLSSTQPRATSSPRHISSESQTGLNVEGLLFSSPLKGECLDPSSSRAGCDEPQGMPSSLETQSPPLALAGSSAVTRGPSFLSTTPTLVPRGMQCELLDILAKTSLSLHGMEVVNKLTSVIDLPNDFLRDYISNCIRSCMGTADKYVQSRLVRLVCVFLQVRDEL